MGVCRTFALLLAIAGAPPLVEDRFRSVTADREGLPALNAYEDRLSVEIVPSAGSS